MTPIFTSSPSKAAAGAVGGKTPDAHHIRGFQVFDGAAQGAVAGREKRAGVRCVQRVGCPVGPAFADEHQGAIIGHEKPPEKNVGGAEVFPGPAPQALPADLFTGAGEAQDRPLGVRRLRAAYRCFDPHPVAHSADFTERHPGLSHSPRARVHPDQDDLLRALSVPVQVVSMGLCGIYQRIVHVRHRRAESKAFHLLHQVGGKSVERYRCAASAHARDNPTQRRTSPSTCTR